MTARGVAVPVGQGAPRSPANAQTQAEGADSQPSRDPLLVGESVTVIVPVTERAGEIAALHAEYAPAVQALGCPVDFIFVVEAKARAATPLAALRESDAAVRVFEVAHAPGEAALLKLGRARTTASIIVTMPSRRRIRAEALPELVRAVARGADLAVAGRSPRIDSWVNRIQSRALHGLIGLTLGGGIDDVRCGVWAMRPRVIDETTIYGDLLLFLPIVAARQGFRVVQIAARQHTSDVGPRFYAPTVYVRRLLDILALFVLLRFSEKPLRFFGSLGLVSGATGALLLAMVFFQRLGGQPIANRPILLLAGLLVVIGVEAIAVGLIGEIIVYLDARYLRGSPGYRLREDDE